MAIMWNIKVPPRVYDMGQSISIPALRPHVNYPVFQPLFAMVGMGRGRCPKGKKRDPISLDIL